MTNDIYQWEADTELWASLRKNHLVTYTCCSISKYCSQTDENTEIWNKKPHRFLYFIGIYNKLSWQKLSHLHLKVAFSVHWVCLDLQRQVVAIHNAHQSVNSEYIMNLLDFMGNNTPKWRWQGTSKHNVLNLAVNIQQPTDLRAKFKQKMCVVKLSRHLLQRTKGYDYGDINNRPEWVVVLFILRIEDSLLVVAFYCCSVRSFQVQFFNSLTCQTHTLYRQLNNSCITFSHFLNTAFTSFCWPATGRLAWRHYDSDHV